MVPRGLRHRVAEPKDSGSIAATVAAFLMEVRREDTRLFEISALV